MSAAEDYSKSRSSKSSQSYRLSLYIRPDVRAKLVDVAGWLDDRGVPVRDQRGNISLSAAVAYLVNEKALELTQQSDSSSATTKG